MCEQDVGPTHRLGALAVGIAGKDRVDPVFRLGHERASQDGHGRVEFVDRVEGPEAQVSGDLVVAGAAGVELPGHGADFFVQQPLDERVYVLVWRAHGCPVGEALGDAVEAVLELRLLGGRHNADPAERVHPRLARDDVLRPEAMMDGEAAVQRVERFARSQREAPAPHLMDVRRWGHRSARRSIRRQSCSPAHKAG